MAGEASGNLQSWQKVKGKQAHLTYLEKKEKGEGPHTLNTKISRVWWHMPVIPATWEAKAGELLKSKRWRMQ